MALSNNLKKQVDVPVWEWCRFAPGVSSAISASCTADNSLYHVTFGRYIYYLQANATLATTTGLTGFFRYDTISDSYQLLAQPPIAPVGYTALQFAGGQGYFGYVLGPGGGLNTLQIPAMSGQTLKGFDIRITAGTGAGQQRIITGAADPVIWDNGTATAVVASPQGNITDSNKNWALNQWAGYQVRLVSSSGQSQARKILYNSSNTLYFADVAKFAEDPWAWSPIVTIAGSALVIASATAGSQTMYQIESSVITVDSNWATVPDSSSRFVVRGGGIWMLTQGTTIALQYYDVLADQWYIRNGGAATSPVTAVGTDGTMVNTGENATVWDRGVATGTQSTTTIQDTSKSWTVNQWVGYHVRIYSGTGENQYRTVTSNTSNTLTVSAWTTITPDATTRYFIEAFEMGTLTSAGAMTQTGVSTGTINGSVFTAGSTTGVYYPGQILSGTGVQSTTTILSAVADCYTTSTSTTINFASGNPSTLGITVGMVVSINSIVGLPGQAGSGTLAAGNPTYVTAVSSSTVTVNIAVATPLVSVTLQFTTAWVSPLAAHTNAGNIITLASGNTTGLYPGMYITMGAGTGTIPVGAYVAQVIDSTHFTISQAPTVALSGSVWLLGQGYQTVIQNQLTGVPGGAGTYSVFPSQVVASTTITGTGVGTVTDTTKAWADNRWNNYVIRIKSGTGAGQARQILDTTSNGAVAYTSASGATNVGATITVGSTTNLAVNQMLNVTSGTGAFAYGTYVLSITNSTTFIASAAPTVNLASSAVVTGTANNTLIVYPNWTTAPDNTSVYVIHGDTDKNYFSTAAQAPTFIHNIEADLATPGRQLERGVARGVSAQYSDYEPVAVSTSVPVLAVTGGYGFVAGVAVTGASGSSNIATVTYTTAAASTPFPVGSWITIAGVLTSTQYNGTWQVTASSPGSVSFYSTTATGAYGSAGTVAQAASVNLAVGTLAGGNWTRFGAATTLTITGCVPSTYNGSMTVSCGAAGTTGSTFGGYQSAAGATSSSTTITVGNTVGLVAGAIPTVTAGIGSFAAGTVVTSVTDATHFVVSIAPSVALSGGASVVTVVPSVAITSSTPVGSLVTYGVVQKTPQASTAITGAAGTVTLTTSNTVFPVGSWIVVTGAVPGTYNGIFQVTGGTAGTTVTYANATTTTATTQCLVGIATLTQLVTTVNNHNLQTGMVVSHRGDQGFSAAANNISAAITVMSPTAGTAATQYTYPVGSAAAQMFVYGQTTTTLLDAAKNWVPNQWAGAQVTYTSTQFTTANVQPTILTAYILANTSNTLIFAAAHTTAPLLGVTRYVITAPATAQVGNTIGSFDSGLVQGAQLVTQLQDVTKSWVMPLPVTGITGTTITVGAATVVITGSMNNILPGMTVAITLGSVSLPLGTVISSISGSTLTLSNNFGGSGTTATFTFAATASSSGNVVTVTGYPLVNLAPGMKLAVTSTTNLSTQVLSTGAFVLNGGANFTPVTVLSITSATTFTISAIPTVPLANATVQATFWVPSQLIGRRVRITSGITINNVEAIVTANTVNTLTFLTIGTSPVHGTNGYAILQQPVIRATGTALVWNFGASNANTLGKYLYQARGGNLPGFDRLNLTTDKWDFLTATPSYETLSTGAMYAYDGADRIYFTVQVTQRMYYLDIESNVIHPAGMYPYAAGTAIVGNRMEIFETVDGLKYIWLNRHSNVECFRQLLFY